MKILEYVFLCSLFFVFSCRENEACKIPGEPDKIIEDITGILHYLNEYETWYIRCGYPGTIDNVDIYLVKNQDKDFHFGENKKVKVSGYCYLTDELFPVPAGTIVYHTIITGLTCE
jgi:hypothetical protein